MQRSAELESSLTERQKTAVKMATIDAMHIVHGGPGTGKSFTIAMIVRMLLNAVDDKDGMSHWRISVCAPTGRAAKRLETIFSSQGLYQLVGPKSSLQVQTIHKCVSGPFWFFMKGTREQGRGNPILSFPQTIQYWLRL